MNDFSDGPASAVLTKENCFSSMSRSMWRQSSAGSSPQSTIPSKAEFRYAPEA